MTTYDHVGLGYAGPGPEVRVCVRKRRGKWHLTRGEWFPPGDGFDDHQEALKAGAFVNASLGLTMQHHDQKENAMTTDQNTKTLDPQPWVIHSAQGKRRAANYQEATEDDDGASFEPRDGYSQNPDECVFCQKIEEGSVQREAFRVYSFEPLNPVTPGHRLFIVDDHFAFPHHDPSLAGLAYSAAARHAGEQGGAYNLIVNAGDAASQTIPHVHVHYVPRERNDGLKLPWTEQHEKATSAASPLPADEDREALAEIIVYQTFHGCDALPGGRRDPGGGLPSFGGVHTRGASTDRGGASVRGW